jgi:hypothetical protein
MRGLCRAMIIKIGDPTGEVPFPTLRSVLRGIREAEQVVIVTFPRILRALIVDFRPADGDYPIAFVATIGYSGEEQLRTVQAARPDAPPIERFSRVTWGGAVTAFDSQGALSALISRVDPERHQELVAAFLQLQEVERGLVKTDRSVGASKSTGEPGKDDRDEPGDPGIPGLTNTTTVAETSAEG